MLHGKAADVRMLTTLFGITGHVSLQYARRCPSPKRKIRFQVLISESMGQSCTAARKPGPGGTQTWFPSADQALIASGGG